MIDLIKNDTKEKKLNMYRLNKIEFYPIVPCLVEN